MRQQHHGKRVEPAVRQTTTATSNVLRNGGCAELLLTPAEAKRFGLPGVSVTAGQVSPTIALATGTITSLTRRGHVVVNVCAALS
jgi:hypothetical protein